MHQLPNVIGFTFGVVQMGLYALYRNATPRVPAKELADDAKEAAAVDGTFKAPAGEHVVTITTLTAAPAVTELIKARDAHPAADAAVAPHPLEEANADRLLAAAIAGRNAEQV